MLQVGFKTDKGIKRSNNEDAYFIVPSENVYIVADGVGGGNSGEVASRTAVSKIAEYVKDNPLNDITDEKMVTAYFANCLDYVNEKIFEEAKLDSQNIGMATTVVIAYITGKIAFIVNVGDSRAYVCRGGKLTQITEDHTYVNSLIKSGVITAEKARYHSERNKITRALGGEEKVVPDFFRVELNDEDVIVLCTDGLHGETDDNSIAKITSDKELSMADMCKKLVNLANRRGGHDNITVVTIRI